jgi:hypothetical protein
MKTTEALPPPGEISTRPAFTMQQKTILIKGVPTTYDAVDVHGQKFVIAGKLLKTASLGQEQALWLEDVEDPEGAIKALKACPARVDMLRFWQRIPDNEAKFPYYKEWKDIAAIPISTYAQWWEKQISPKARNKIRKTQKLGVVTGEAELTDEFVRQIMGIFNQSPVRRGKPFWHYGKDFETVKREMGQDMDHSIFIAAHFQGELIGFIKLFFTDRYAMVTLILDKTAHRDKAPMNGMIAKAVEICAARKVPFITYTVWRRREHGKFQEANGFEKIPVPEYFIPLTWQGRLALSLRLHKGIKGALPEGVYNWLLDVRTAWYRFRFKQKFE